jgi:ADP-heptose:LPS heptosyltransferase
MAVIFTVLIALLLYFIAFGLYFFGGRFMRWLNSHKKAKYRIVRDLDRSFRVHCKRWFFWEKYALGFNSFEAARKFVRMRAEVEEARFKKPEIVWSSDGVHDYVGE